MARTFETVQEGWEYETEGYIIKRFSVEYGGEEVVNQWMIHPEKENRIYVSPTLEQAKDFIIARDAK